MRQLVAVFDDAVLEPLVGVVDALDQRVVDTQLFIDSAASIQIASTGGPYCRRPGVFPRVMQPHQAINSDSLRTVRKQILGEGATHGLRSTFRTYCADQGLERDLAEACLGHVVGNSTERSYQRSDIIERRREVMQQWADFVLSPHAAETL